VIVDNYLDGYHIPIAHPGLVRLLDYKRYEADIHENYVWFEAPHREEPTDNRLVRLYSRLVRPMPGLDAEDLRVWRYVFIYPNTILDVYPDQVDTWKIRPKGVDRIYDDYDCFRPANSGLRNRIAQRLNIRLNSEVGDEDIDLVANVQAGLATRGYECGPLSERDAALGWFADRVRADLAAEL
jgi:choline monooxygenase